MSEKWPSRGEVGWLDHKGLGGGLCPALTSFFLTMLLRSSACPGGLLVGWWPGNKKHWELGACLFSPKFYVAAAGPREPEAPFVLVRVSELSPPEACLPVCYEYPVRIDAS